MLEKLIKKGRIIYRDKKIDYFCLEIDGCQYGIYPEEKKWSLVTNKMIIEFDNISYYEKCCIFMMGKNCVAQLAY